MLQGASEGQRKARKSSKARTREGIERERERKRERERRKEEREEAGREGKQVKKIYVGNLAFSTTDQELQELFEQHGSVSSAKVITDRETGRSRGFGFVEMDDDAAADKAIAALDGSQVGGRDLRVNEAHERGSGPPQR
jgi:RNA recognition motif-containing protein